MVYNVHAHSNCLLSVYIVVNEDEIEIQLSECIQFSVLLLDEKHITKKYQEKNLNDVCIYCWRDQTNTSDTLVYL